MAGCKKLLLIAALAALCAHGALAAKCNEDVGACDAKGKACADKACVDCSDSAATCKQCAGREARETEGAYGEKDGYKPWTLDASKGTCVACDPEGTRGCDLAAGCALAAGAPVCLKCALGFYSTGDVEGGVTCAKCKGGCDDKGCDDKGVCLGACAEGFTKQGDTCVACKAEGCVKCSADPAKCEECSQGDMLFLDDSGNCRQLDDLDEWCGAASPDGACTSCLDGFRLTAKGGCEQCDGTKMADGTEMVGTCTECPDSKSKCSVCEGGYFLEAGKCLECKTQGCRKCTATECLECGDGSVLDPKTKTCIECGNECSACTTPGGACTACYWGEPDADGVCPAAKPSPPCDVDGCERCVEGDANTCELCEARTKRGFYSFVSGACVYTPFDLA